MINEIKVVSLKKKKNNYEVLLSNETKIEATEDLVLKYKLFENHILDVDDLSKIKDDSLYFILYEKALGYLAKNMSSKGKMIEYLINKGASECLANKIVNELSYKKILDDEKYMESICSHYIKMGYGRYYILNMAYKYKIDKQLATDILESYDDEIFIEGCISVGKKKLKSLSNYDEYKRKNKLAIYLQNRGFEFDIISKCLKEIL